MLVRVRYGISSVIWGNLNDGTYFEVENSKVQVTVELENLVAQIE